MRIGVPREIAPQEGRVALVPSAVRLLVSEGHEVLVEQGAGTASGLPDDEYLRAGAELVPTPEELYERAELVWKVCPPRPPELPHLRAGQLLFSFLHLPAAPGLREALAGRGVLAFAMERLEAGGERPLQRPMSEVAGRLAVQAGAAGLERQRGGRGLLLGGVPGVPPARVGILGGGTAGSQAAALAVGLGAEVSVLDEDPARLRRLDELFRGRVRTLHASQANLEALLFEADLLVGAVGRPGERSPLLVSREQLGIMKPGAVIVDVSIASGGCVETSRPSTHAEPYYVVDGIVHHAVPNLPGAVPLTSTFALVAASLPHGARLAALGERAVRDPVLSTALERLD